MSLPVSNPQPDTPEARQYNLIRRRLEVADLALGLGFLVVLLVTGWSNNLRDWAWRAGSYPIRLFIYVLFLSVISKLLGVGLDFYSFRLEHRFHLSNQKPVSWIRDQFKGWLIGLVIGTCLAEIVYGLMGLAPVHWWIWAWL